MDNKEMLLRKISTAQFAAWELHIYLDTHPNDVQAIESYKKYQEKTKNYIAEYEKKYGPLCQGDPLGDGRWEWIHSPWPWELNADGVNFNV